MPASSIPSPAYLSRTPSFWHVQLIGWVAFSIVLLPVKNLFYASLPVSLLITAYQLPVSLLLTGIMRHFYRGAQPTAQSFGSAALLVLVSCAVASALDLMISIPANQVIGAGGPVDLVEPALYIFRGIVYLVWSLGYFLIKYQLAYRQLAFQSAVAAEKLRLDMLRYQLNPKFLANSLAVIADEIGQDPSIARAITTRLAHFYHATLRQTEKGEPATLGDELELLRAYLGIETLRLGQALTVHYQVDDSLLTLPLPPLFLLPLAEQAVQNGRRTLPKAFAIKVTAQKVEDGHALLELSYTGRLHEAIPAEPAIATDSDILDLRTRLERHYPGRHRFIQTQDSTRVRSTLYLPLTP